MKAVFKEEVADLIKGVFQVFGPLAGYGTHFNNLIYQRPQILFPAFENRTQDGKYAQDLLEGKCDGRGCQGATKDDHE